MPQLRQYLAQVAPQGRVSPVIPDSPHVGGLVAGATRAANVIQHGADVREAQIAHMREQMAHESEQIAREEAQAAVSKTISEKRAYYTESIINRQQSGQPLAGMTAELLQQFDKDTEQTIAGAPELGRKAMTLRMADLKTSIHERAFGMESDARRAQVVTDFSDGLDADARVLFADHTQLAGVLGSRLAAANALMLDPQTKAKLLDSTRETLAYSAASGLVDKSPDGFLARTGNAGGKTGKDGKPLPSDPAKAAEAVKNDPMLSNLKPAHLQALVEKATTLSVMRQAQADAEAERRRARAEAEANKREREAITAYTVLSDRARNGIATDPTRDPHLMRQLSSSPMLMKAYQEQAAEIPKRAAVAQLPLAQQQAQIDQLRAMRVAGGTNTELESELKKREAALADAKKAYADEPLRAGAERGIVPALAPLNTANLDTIEQGLPARAQQAYSVATRAGRDVSPMTHEEAGAWLAQINALPFDQRGQRIARMTQQVGPQQAQALAAQIDAKDRALSLEIAVGATQTTQGRTVGELIRRGAQAVKDKTIREDTMAESGTRASLAAEVGFLNGKAREDVIDAARYILLGKQAAGEKVDYRNAVELALGGKIIEHNGKPLPAPPRFDEARFKAGLAAMTPADLPSRVMFTPDGQTMSAQDFLRQLPAAVLEPAGTGRYNVRGPGGFIMGENRRALTIEVK